MSTAKQTSEHLVKVNNPIYDQAHYKFMLYFPLDSLLLITTNSLPRVLLSVPRGPCFAPSGPHYNTCVSPPITPSRREQSRCANSEVWKCQQWLKKTHLGSRVLRSCASCWLLPKRSLISSTMLAKHSTHSQQMHRKTERDACICKKTWPQIFCVSLFVRMAYFFRLQQGQSSFTYLNYAY